MEKINKLEDIITILKENGHNNIVPEEVDSILLIGKVIIAINMKTKKL